MEIGKIYNLIYMITIPILILFIFLGYRKKIKIAKKFKIILSNIRYFKEFLFIVGIILIILSLIEPKKESGIEKVERKGTEIYFLIDISKSMLCSDVKPTRLERSRDSIKRIINSLDGDRVGFIPFSQAAYIQMPLTDDYEMANTFIDMIDATLISGGGTNISSAIEVADEGFESSKNIEKIVVIFSDGEEQEEKKIEKKDEDNKKIYCVSIGTEIGGVVPEVDEMGNIVGFKNDEYGNPVITKVKEENLTNISKKYNGKTYRVDNTNDDTNKIISELASANKGKIKEEEKKIYKHYYQYILGVGIIMFLIGYFGITAGYKKSS
jgi:Ca-activated chloride channel homolog